MRHASLFGLMLSLVLPGCDDPASSDAGPPDAQVEDAQVDDAGTPDAGEETRFGFEIFQVVSPTEIVVWLPREPMTLAEFEALELPSGWLKNQPREVDPSGGRFLRSPGASADGEFVEEEHFGRLWWHNATVVEANTPIDDAGLLRLNRVAKFHEVTYAAGNRVPVLVSPEGEVYLRVSRDGGRTVETPTMPAGWRLFDFVVREDLTFLLPNPTVNIRGDNEDSFQGPVEVLAPVFGPDAEANLMLHDGYWEAELPGDGAGPVTAINDLHYDPATRRATVYAQTLRGTEVLAPPQVGPGECAETADGPVCFHPNAVYLNGSGDELAEADGSGAWWVRHSWVVDGEGYENCPLSSSESYTCIPVEGELLDEGLAMRIGDTRIGAFNVRTVLVNEDPVRYEIARFLPGSDDSDWVLSLTCNAAALSPLDNQARPCPASRAE